MVEQSLSNTIVVRKTQLCSHWWSNSCQLHLVCEAQNFVVTVGGTAFNCTCAKHRIALSLLLRRISIKLVVRSTELLCHWWSNGSQLHLCEAQLFIVTVGATVSNYTLCAKHSLALSLVEQRLSITFGVRNTEERCHWLTKCFQLQMLCETQNCFVTG